MEPIKVEIVSKEVSIRELFMCIFVIPALLFSLTFLIGNQVYADTTPESGEGIRKNQTIILPPVKMPVEPNKLVIDTAEAAAKRKTLAEEAELDARMRTARQEDIEAQRAARKQKQSPAPE